MTDPPVKKQPSHITPQAVVDALLVENPFRFHAEGSPYLGLSVKEQKVLQKLRRGPGRTPKYILEQQRKATKKDYEKLLLACTETLIYAWHNDSIRLDRVNVYLKVPFNYRDFYDKRLPHPFIVAYDDWTVTLSFRVEKVVDWLYEIGHSTFSGSQLKKYIWKMCQDQAKLDLYYEIATDESIIQLYSDLIGDAEKEVAERKGKGKGKWKKRIKKVVENPVKESLTED